MKLMAENHPKGKRGKGYPFGRFLDEMKLMAENHPKGRRGKG